MDRQITALVIDDEPLAIRRVVNLLNEEPSIDVVGECSSGSEAISLISSSNPDLIFLDIHLSDMTGFDVLKQLDQQRIPMTIFITAYDDYALKAFDYYAFDYLLKPFKDQRFYDALKKVKHSLRSNHTSLFDKKISDLVTYIENSNSENNNLRSQKLPIKTSGKVHFLDKSEIKYIQASGYYSEIFTDEKKHLLRESLTSLINKLPKSEFIRVHRSTIINTNQIKELIYSNFGEIDVKMSDEKLFRVSKSYKKSFLTHLGI